MNYFVRFLLFFVFVIFAFYYAWSEGDRNLNESDYSKLTADTPVLVTRSIGYDHNAGNIVAIQAFMNVFDYSSSERYFEKLDSYLSEAKRRGMIKEGSIVVFPEHIGTPLVLLGEKKDVYFSETISSAFSLIAFGNLFGYFKVYLEGNFGNAGEIIFRMKANDMLATYESTFKKLSSTYNVSIFAGSILLPEPEIVSGNLQIKKGNIYNSGFLFLPDGSIYSQVLRKQTLGKLEKQIVASGSLDAKFLSWKKFGFLLSNDTIYSSNFDEKVKSTEILISPSALFEQDEIDWNNPDIYGKDPLDSSLTQPELWRKFGIFEKMKTASGNRIIVQVFLLGKFFDLTLEGESAGLIRYVATEGLINKSPAILNVWF